MSSTTQYWRSKADAPATVADPEPPPAAGSQPADDDVTGLPEA